ELVARAMHGETPFASACSPPVDVPNAGGSEALLVVMIIGVGAYVIQYAMSRREVGAVQRDTARPAEPGELVVANVPGCTFADVRGVTRRARWRLGADDDVARQVRDAREQDDTAIRIADGPMIEVERLGERDDAAGDRG